MSDFLFMLAIVSISLNIILLWALRRQEEFYVTRLEFWFQEALKWQRKATSRGSKDEADPANWWKE